MSRVLGYSRELADAAATAGATDALRDAGATILFSDPVDLTAEGRGGLEDCLRDLAAGDVLVVPSAAHLASSVVDFVSTSTSLRERGVALRSLSEPALSAGVDGGFDASETLAALEDLRHRLVSARTRASMQTASAQGRRMGRPTVMTAERVEIAVELRQQRRSIAHIARVLGVSASSVQRALQHPPNPEVTDSQSQ